MTKDERDGSASAHENRAGEPKSEGRVQIYFVEPSQLGCEAPTFHVDPMEACATVLLLCVGGDGGGGGPDDHS